MKVYYRCYLVFLIPLICSSQLFASTDFKEDIFQEVFIETEKHKEYLSQIGLSERAQGIQICHFKKPELIVTDLSIFDKRTSLPSEVSNFEPKEPNTLLMGSSTVNDPTELAKILDTVLQFCRPDPQSVLQA